MHLTTPKALSYVTLILLGASSLQAKPDLGNAQKQERNFSAGQVFNYKQPILFESDFGGQGLDKWNLSEDDRYRLTKTDPNRLRITDAPGMAGGAKVVRFFVPREPNSFRAEISLPSEKGFNERWYGILTYVSEDWKIDPNKGADILIQWHAIPGNWRSTHPNLTICIQNSNWQIRRNYGSPQKNPERELHNLEKPFQPGAWVSWVIHAKWSPGKDGLVRIWKNGDVVLNQKAQCLWHDRQGIYALPQDRNIPSGMAPEFGCPKETV